MHRCLIFLSLFSAISAQAADDYFSCWNSDKTAYNCNEGSRAAVGASAPLLGDTLKTNPAALPTQPTPFGIEGMYSNRSFPDNRPKFSASTVKGFKGIGFGIGGWTDGTFSAPNFPAHFLSSALWQEYKEYEQNPRSVLGIRLGTTILLPQALFPKGIRLSLGGSVGLGRVSGELAPQAGVLMKFFRFALGYSQSHERLTKKLPKTRITNFAAGLPLGPLYFGYTYSVMHSIVNTTFANTYGLRVNAGKWTLHGGLKQQRDHRGQPDSWTAGGIQRQFGSRFGLGYEYGYYRYSHSAVVQIFL